MTELQFEPPGPGTWTRENVHSPRPVPLLSASIVTEPFREGMSRSFRRYGFLLDHLELRAVHGFVYAAARPVGAPPSATRRPPRIVLMALMRLHPDLRRRVRTAGRLFVDRPWVDDLERWDREVKPAAIAAHLALQAVDVDLLDDAALADHLDRCIDHARRMITQHHDFTAAAIVPVADFMANSSRWTGRPFGDLLSLMQGTSSVSRAWADGLDRVVDAIRADEEGRRLLHAGGEAGKVLDRLRQRPAPTGPAVDHWLRHVGTRLVDGLDLGCPTALEVPEVLVKCLQASVATGAAGEGEGVAERAKAVRDDVPPEDHDEFDRQLADARALYRIRDERGVYSDSWGSGILRRAVLQAGQRLTARGRVDAPDHLLETTPEELRAVVSGTGGPEAAELARRAGQRAELHSYEPPAVLGPPAAPPPPVEWIPARARRLATAVGLFLGNMFTPPDVANDAAVVRGTAASPGVREGTARVMRDSFDFVRVEEGDVLVMPTTTESCNVVVPLLAAIVTDHGGPVSHAAIVAREAGIPAVVGCADATRAIPDGARVRVDGDTGEVTILP